MSGEGEEHKAKRQRTEEGEGGLAAGSTAAQRSAFAEDSARIRAALAVGSSSAVSTAAGEAADSAAGSRQEHRPNDSPQQPQQHQPPDDSDDDEESGGGSWLSNYSLPGVEPAGPARRLVVVGHARQQRGGGGCDR